jgi:2-desacetyl-2-hydroxyethyl bacteriochlorophyllide A dehydrogenase
MEPRALYFTAPYEVAVREEPLSRPAAGQVLVQTLVSAISPGTELLIFRDQAPADLAVDETITALPGNFGFPLKYGYAAVGRVIELGPEVPSAWQGMTVFAFNPHESLFLAAPEALLPLPPDLTPEEAVFLANMETGVTLLQDGRPLIGEQVAVFGQGIVGLLLTSLLARFPLERLVTLDVYPRRRLASETMGAHVSLNPGQPGPLEKLAAWLPGTPSRPGADLVYEISGNPAALDQAIGVTGFGGRVVIGSWYGAKETVVHLGGRFHRSRIKLLSSQVSTIAPDLTGRWDNPRRLNLAWEMIRQIRPAQLITHRFPFEEAAQAYQLLDKNPEDAIQVVLTY